MLGASPSGWEREESPATYRQRQLLWKPKKIFSVTVLFSRRRRDHGGELENPPHDYEFLCFCRARAWGVLESPHLRKA